MGKLVILIILLNSSYVKSQVHTIPIDWVNKSFDCIRIFDDALIKSLQQDSTLERIYHSQINLYSSRSLFYFSDTNKVELYYLGTISLDRELKAGIIFCKENDGCNSSETIYYCTISENKFDELHILFNKRNDCLIDYEYCSVLYNQGLLSFNITNEEVVFNPHFLRFYLDKDSIVDMGDALQKSFNLHKNYNFLSLVCPKVIFKSSEIETNYCVPLSFVYHNEVYERKVAKYSVKNKIELNKRFLGLSKNGWIITYIGKDEKQKDYYSKVKGTKIKINKQSAF